MSTLEDKLCGRIEEVVVDTRDLISALPDELLIQILLLVSTKDAVTTMLLSKRWRFLWTMVPKLEYKYSANDDNECQSVRNWRFLGKSLEFHKAPVLETLCIQLKVLLKEDVGKLVTNAVDRFVRKLDLELFWTIGEPSGLPKSLYTCKTLVELTLSNKILVDVPSSACLPSIKILRLYFVVYKDAGSLVRLLSSCSALARSKVCLCVCNIRSFPLPVGVKFPYNKPHILVLCNADDKFLRAISLVTALYISLKDPKSLDALKTSGFTFSRLQRFVLRPTGHLWLDQIPLILNKSPKLLSLHIRSVNGYQPGNLPMSWYQPSFVPRCLSTHLEYFSWCVYSGSEEEKQLVRYILANSKCLKIVLITLKPTLSPEEKEKIVKELVSMSRVSTMSQLRFE